MIKTYPFHTNKMTITEDSITFSDCGPIVFTRTFSNLLELQAMVKKWQPKFFTKDSKAIRDTLQGKRLSVTLELPSQFLPLLEVNLKD